MLNKIALALLGLYTASAIQLTTKDCSGTTCTGRDMVNNYQTYYCDSVDPTNSACTGAASGTTDDTTSGTTDDTTTDTFTSGSATSGSGASGSMMA